MRYGSGTQLLVLFEHCFCFVQVVLSYFFRSAVHIEAINNIGVYHDRICIVFYAIVIKLIFNFYSGSIMTLIFLRKAVRHEQ